MVIAPGLLVELAPTQMATKGVLITQFDLESIERLGLVKIDLLGIRGLTCWAMWPRRWRSGGKGSELAGETGKSSPAGRRAGGRLDLLRPSRGRPADCGDRRARADDRLLPDRSPGMRATLKEVRARSVDDLMAALALYRPGPLTGGLKDAFVARYRGLQPASTLHPALEPLLGDTYGVILYQEQVLRIAHELAGLTLAEADLLRRAMSHFDPGKQMQQLKERFIAGALSRSGMPESIAERTWELMAAFAGYGFPKAHAASYARVAWQSAWCKTHHRRCSWRRCWRTGRLLWAAGVPDGSAPAGAEAAPTAGQLRPARVQRPLPGGPADPVHGPEPGARADPPHPGAHPALPPLHVLSRFPGAGRSRPIEAENLARAGALEGFGSIPALLSQLEGGGWRGGQLPLFELGGADMPDWSLEQKTAAQEAVLGVGLAAHPLELAAAQIADAGALNTVEAAGRLGQRVRVAGMRQTWRRSRTASGDYIYFMALEDLEGMLEVVIAGPAYRRERAVFSGRAPFVLEGVVELDMERGEPFIRAERAWRLG